MPACEGILLIGAEPVLKRAFIGRSSGAFHTACMPIHHRPTLSAALLPLLVPLLMAPGMAWGSPGEDRDHDRARAAVAAGEVMPLPKLLEVVRKTHPGQVLEVELEREHGRWVYELRLLQPGGRLLKLHLDARNAEPIDRKGRERDDTKRGHERQDATPR